MSATAGGDLQHGHPDLPREALTQTILVGWALPGKPEVVAVALASGRSRHETVGLLVDLWCWFARAGGGAEQVSVEGDEWAALALAVGADESFWKAVACVGWLSAEGGRVALPRAERWFGPKPYQVGRPGSENTGDPLFDRFWAAYPRKEAKTAARKAWMKLNPPDAMLDRMLTALARQKESDAWRRNFIPHPATWLNNRRWEDEPFESGGRVGPHRVAGEPGKYDGIGEQLPPPETEDDGDAELAGA